MRLKPSSLAGPTPASQRARGLISDRRGATAIEFALIGPVFLLVLFALFDIGRLVLVRATMEFAAQEGADFASMRGSSSMTPTTDEAVASQVRARIHGVDPEAVSVSVTWSPDGSSGSTVLVRTAYEHRVLMGLLPIAPLALTGQASLTVF